MTRYAVLFTAAMLSGCASLYPSTDKNGETASLQNAVYIVGEGMPAKEAAATGDTDKDKDEMSSLKRVYWFFAGR